MKEVEMKNRHRRYWILLGIAVFLLFIGICLAITFSQRAHINNYAQIVFDKNWDELTPSQQDLLKELVPSVSDAAIKVALQEQWVNTWILTPIRWLGILIVAIVVSQIILNKITPRFAQKNNKPSLK